MPERMLSALQSSRTLQSVLLGVGVFLLCLAGILSRPHFELASFWPANAFMLGMLVRFPRLAAPASWAACAAGFFLADAATNAPLAANLILNGGNLLVVFMGYRLFRGLRRQDRVLRRPESILYFLRVILGMGLTSGLVGAGANPALFDGSRLEGFVFWSVGEMVNSIALLPVLLTLPKDVGLHPTALIRRLERMRPGRIAPLLALLVSMAASTLFGGPGTVAFPVPALLWCALSYRLFTTTCLALLFGLWTLLAIRTGLLTLGMPVDSRDTLISIRVGVTLIALGPLVVASVMSARLELFERMRVLADRDSMTGLRNRRAFTEAATRLLDAWRPEQDGPVAVMMLDIDHFKSINDTHGHDGGDQVIAAFAGVLEHNVRPQDIVGRVGGEEFAALLPGCGPDEANMVARRIRQRLESAHIRLREGSSLRITVSIGVHVEEREKTLESLLSQADKALYRAKTTGRNRIVMSPASQAEVPGYAALA